MVQNSRDWLRQAQRIPVAVALDDPAQFTLRQVRIGGQADVLVYTGDNPLINLLGAGWIRLMSLLSFLY